MSKLKTKARSSKRTATAPDAPSPPATPFDPAAAPARLSRLEAAAFLTALGFRISTKTLAQMGAGRREGPPFRFWNGRSLYDKADLISWAESQLSPKARNTSERADLARLAGARKVTGKPKGKTAERSAAEAARP